MKIVLYTVWALFAVGITLTLIHQFRKSMRQEKLIASWPKAWATVTGSVAGWSNGGGSGTRSRRFFATYQFADPYGTLFAGESEVSNANPPVPGSFVEVAYNPLNPVQSFQVKSGSSTVLGIAAAVFAAVLTGMFFFIGVFTG